MNEEAKKIVLQTIEQYKAGDAGAPFERPVLQALIKMSQEDIADFQRMRSTFTDAGIPLRDLNKAFKMELEKSTQTKSVKSGEQLFPTEKIKELEENGFVVDPYKGVTDIQPNLFAKYVLKTFKLRFTTGERFYYYKNGVWKPLREKQLQRFLYDLIERVQKNVWRPAWENGYMTTLARSAKYVSEFDTHRNCINLANGMFNTETFELKEHDPVLHSSIQNLINYEPDAECPRFLKFLNEIFQGDQQIIKVVQEMIGYCCTAETRAHKMFILEGIGSNVKSVLIEVIEYLCGKQNVSHVPMNELSQPFARAELVGKLLNVSSENEFSQKGLNTQQIKTLTVGDMIRVENKHEKGFSYQPVCKLLFGLNTLPATLDKSHGFFRRLVIIPFRRVFKGADADIMLLEKLLEELPGILNFAMEGLERLRANDYVFSNSEAIEQAVSNYKSEQNPVITFVADFVLAGNESNRLGKNDLFERFQIWCRQHGEMDFAYKASKDRRVFWAAFRTALLETGLPTPDEATSNGWRYFPGLVLLDERKKSMTDLFDDIEDMKDEKTGLEITDEQLENDAITFEIDFLVNGFFQDLSFNEWLEKTDDPSGLCTFSFKRVAVEKNSQFQERVTVFA